MAKMHGTYFHAVVVFFFVLCRGKEGREGSKEGDVCARNCKQYLATHAIQSPVDPAAAAAAAAVTTKQGREWGGEGTPPPGNTNEREATSTSFLGPPPRIRGCL